MGQEARCPWIAVRVKRMVKARYGFAASKPFINHPFHIHINPYQVVAVNGKPVPVRYSEDTTPVPPLGEITMRTRFRDFPGRWVYHCHILLHEDFGMMGTVRALA